MAPTIGSIVKNLIPTEPVVINNIQTLGSKISLRYTGSSTNRANSKVITITEFEQLEILTDEGTFNFKGDAVKFALFAEAERISSAYQFDPLFAVNCSIVDPLPHQVEAVYKFLLPLPKIRFLLADDTGAGKTIMTGLLIKELMMRGLVERVLIVTPGGLTQQWQEDEMGVKFNLPFTLVNRSRFSSDPNVFHTDPRIVTSIDFIAREDILNVASNAHWDMIVFDECHKLSAYDYGERKYFSKRYRAAHTLSQQCEHLLLLTATPHRGRPDTFKMLLQLLDEDIFATDELAVARIRELEQDGINKFFIRRLKEDMKNWQGQPLYKARHTRTVSYQLTIEEKELYDAVTHYLTRKKQEASESKNIHVSLALAVMQRRLVSSIYAIRNTLKKRWEALKGIADALAKNPNLWLQRSKLEKLEGYDVRNIEDLDELEEQGLEDYEREAWKTILSDPRKFRLFTTAKGPEEIQEEAREVKQLYDRAENLYTRHQEEKKFLELQELLKSNGVLENGKKLVIFTEHKDTLVYLEERLSKSGGYKVATIHGGKSVTERRNAQWAFAEHGTQILIATDAAGEGINLQFCSLLINWDIPWNPNRLEQRMGRIHRYGQKEDVLVFNMVASNTREGQVLERLLQKLDVIRESMGDDRVYDVIQDVLEDVGMNDIINSVLNGQETKLDEFLDQDNEKIKQKFSEKIQEHREKLAHGTVDYQEARKLKERSDERRLQPIYVRMFFERAFKHLGGKYIDVSPDVYRITHLPPELASIFQRDYHKAPDKVMEELFCFDKQVFLDFKNVGNPGTMHYINPGNYVFDSLIKVTRDTYREEALKGTVMISADDGDGYFAFLVKSQIVDNRRNTGHDSVADERLVMVRDYGGGKISASSPAGFIDLHEPTEFAKPVTLPAVVSNDQIVQWSFAEITEPQLDETTQRVENDVQKRQQYLEAAFTQAILDQQAQIQELQQKSLTGDTKTQEKIDKKQAHIHQLINKKRDRLDQLERMNQLSSKAPEVLGCAYVVPLSHVEYEHHYGMSRDDEAEAIAMQMAMEYEHGRGWRPEDVSANNEGYDIRSTSPEALKCYIEVKGRSASDGSVMLSENEMNRLAQLGDSAWLYIVINCKSSPQLYRIQNPAKLLFEKKSKGIQYFLPMKSWFGTVAGPTILQE